MFDDPSARSYTANPIDAKLYYRSFELNELDDVEISEETLELNSVLAYQPMLEKWINVPATGPGDLTANSIGDLRDVNLDLDGNISIDTVNRYYIIGSDVGESNTAFMGMDPEYALGMTLSRRNHRADDVYPASRFTHL